jgi:hypothetical protein
MDFGQVAPGTVATQRLVIASDGSDDCVVEDLGLTPSTDAVFRLASGAVLREVLSAGTSLIASVQFAPLHAGCYGGVLAFPAEKAGIALGAQLIPIAGIGYVESSSCFAVPPPFCRSMGLSNGPLCANGKWRFVAQNQCSRAVTIQSITSTSTDPGDLAVLAGEVPQTVPAGGTSSLIELGFSSDAPPLTYDSATLIIQTDLEGAPFVVSVGGSSPPPSTQTDTFTGPRLLQSRELPLSGTPDPTSFNVMLDGNPLTDNWTYDAIANTVALSGLIALQTSDTASVSYWLTCN